MSVFPKFIVEDDKLIIGKVSYHKDLVSDKEKVKGGGWWSLNKDTNTFTLKGDSHDYGRASIEDIKNCIDKGNVFSNRYQTVNISNIYSFQHSNECGEITELKSK